MKFKQEQKLWKRIVQGDEKSFAKIYDEYINNIYRFVFLKLNSRESAEEIVQDVFWELWKTAKREKAINSIRALLYKIARFKIADYYRSQNITDEADDINGHIDVSNDDLSAEEWIDIKIDIDQLKKALIELKGVYRDVVILKYIDELSNAEVAEILQKTEANVRTIGHRAIKQLKSALRDLSKPEL